MQELPKGRRDDYSEKQSCNVEEQILKGSPTSLPFLIPTNKLQEHKSVSSKGDWCLIVDTQQSI